MATERSHSIWHTPSELVKVMLDEFQFDLDAAANEHNHIVPRWLGPGSELGEDALTAPWLGKNVWLNCPYGEGHSQSIGDFVKRGYEQHLEQKNTVVMLLPAYTDPRYFSNYCMQAHEIRFLTGRLAFLEAGVKRMSARFPSMLVIFKHFPGVCHKAPHIWTWAWRDAS